MELLTDAEAWVSLATLTILEIVLGIDNIIFISIQADKLPEAQQAKARKLGLLMAMLTRILLLFSLSYIMTLTKPFVSIGPMIGITNTEWVEKLALSGRDMILLVGGLFLIYKSVHEIHEKIDHDEDEETSAKGGSFWGTILQIMLLDIVFSLDSVITAVGLAKHIEVMVAAVVVSVGIMMWAATPIANFVNKHATVKMLALSFLLLIGVSLLAEAFNQEIPKGYIYFSMAFAILVEMLNLKMRNKRKSTKGANPKS